eukprot:g8987.t1
MVPVTNALGGPQGANNNVEEQQIKARLKQALEDLKTGAINKNQFFDQVKTERMLQDTKLVDPAELKRMVELTELNPIRALGHANGLYDLMVKQSWTTSEALIVMLLASGQCGVLSGNHTRLAMQKYMAENGGEKMMALRIHFVALSEILFHDDMKEVTKRLVAVCNGGRKAMRETWAEKMDSIPMYQYERAIYDDISYGYGYNLRTDTFYKYKYTGSDAIHSDNLFYGGGAHAARDAIQCAGRQGVRMFIYEESTDSGSDIQRLRVRRTNQGAGCCLSFF